MNEMLEKARAIEKQIIADRRCLHQIPEVGVYTPKTAEYVKRRLSEMGISHHDCGIHTQEEREKMVFAGYPDAPESTGVVGLIGKGGPCILLRADMDGLPMEETSGLEFASKGNTAHMCGHDAHAAMLLGAAQILKEMEDELPGTVKLMFQPGEEMGYGSRTMVDDGLLENPKVDAAMALHVGSQVEVGKLNYSPGVASGAMATFIVSIQGKGGHSSEPQKTIDPVNIATQVCSALNMLIPREVDPEAFATMTVGALNGGRASNIIPDTAEIMVSFRTLSPEAYDHLIQRIPEILDHYIKAWRGTYDVRVLKTPSTVCDPEFSAEIVPFAAEILGEENVKPVPPMKGAEDFGHVTRHVPGFYAFMGAGSPGGYPLHNPNMVLDESAFAIGTAILANSAVKWLKSKAGK
ncbi:MAG: M20 family metallopeptidase [Clostridiales bacterium]|uniref:M20 metallopeptidase family protein n=1 Tax=Flavonifractor porci TaxID=3133422 RepID=UPI00309F1C06|nr:M20 family metallopeptidase [Clostridiales bacterium]